MKRYRVKLSLVVPSLSRTKTQHKNNAGLLQLLDIPKWKWDRIAIDCSWTPKKV